MDPDLYRVRVHDMSFVSTDELSLLSRIVTRPLIMTDSCSCLYIGLCLIALISRWRYYRWNAAGALRSALTKPIQLGQHMQERTHRPHRLAANAFCDK
jgi:hypothetical protein